MAAPGPGGAADSPAGSVGDGPGAVRVPRSAGGGKALKAVLLARGVRFPFVHDLERLVELLERDGLTLPTAAREAGQLTAYAVLTRYPHDDVVTDDEFRQALATAEAVIRWAQSEFA